MKKPVIFCALMMGLYTILNSTSKGTVNPLSIKINGNSGVCAWNDLDKHCLKPSYKQVIPPPYNHVLVQLLKHDLKHSTNLLSLANHPVLCAGCQTDPVQGIMTGSQKYLSRMLHVLHSDNLKNTHKIYQAFKRGFKRYKISGFNFKKYAL